MLDATIIIPYRTPDVRLRLCLEGLADAVADHRVEILLICNGGADPGSLGNAEITNAGLSGRALTVESPTTPYALSSARNLGFQEAGSDLVLCLDSDCVPGRTWLIGFLEVSAEMDNPMFMIAGERRFVSTPAIREPTLAVAEQLSSVGRVASHANRGHSLDVRIPRMQMIEETTKAWDLMHGGNLATTKTAWTAAGRYNSRFDGNWGFEDAEFAYRVLQMDGSKAAFSPRSFVYHLEEDSPTQTRPHRDQNPNWALASQLIPGFRQYKMEQYRLQEQA